MKYAIDRDYNNIKTVEVSTSKRPLTLSVDRKYVGREVSFISEKLSDSDYRYMIITMINFELLTTEEQHLIRY